MCQENLSGREIFFCDMIAFCAECSKIVTMGQVHNLKLLRDEYGYHHCFTEARGLSLYTPPEYMLRNMAAWMIHTPELVKIGQTNAPMNSWDRTTAKRADA